MCRLGSFSHAMLCRNFASDPEQSIWENEPNLHILGLSMDNVGQFERITVITLSNGRHIFITITLSDGRHILVTHTDDSRQIYS